MLDEVFQLPASSLPARRRFLFDSVNVTLSAAAVATLASVPGLARAAARSDDAVATDLRILNTALAAEREAVAAYGVGAASGLLTPPTLKVATAFQEHHKQHGGALEDAIRKLGGTPGDARNYEFPVSDLKTEADVLTFAAELERGAVSAYAGAIPLFEHRDLSKAAASILADEAMHWAILRQALGLEPVPGAFFA